MAFALKAAASIPTSPAASAAGSASSASFSAAVPRSRAAATGRVSFRGAAAPVVAVRAAAVAPAAVAEDKRSISGTFAELREQGKVSP
jgi:tryptophan synthase alpha chain